MYSFLQLATPENEATLLFLHCVPSWGKWSEGKEMGARDGGKVNPITHYWVGFYEIQLFGWCCWAHPAKLDNCSLRQVFLREKENLPPAPFPSPICQRATYRVLTSSNSGSWRCGLHVWSYRVPCLVVSRTGGKRHLAPARVEALSDYTCTKSEPRQRWWPWWLWQESGEAVGPEMAQKFLIPCP